jgi:hypothetical protein
LKIIAVATLTAKAPRKPFSKRFPNLNFRLNLKK